MDMKKDLDNILGMSYDEYVETLLKKYGPAITDYFTDDTYEYNGSYSRTKEGLVCHHIDEDKVVLLSSADHLKESNVPFRYQKKDRLVYCDYIEHLLLHMKIMEKELNKRRDERNNNEPVGIGGFTNIVVDITELFYYLDEGFPKGCLAWKINCAKKIEGLEKCFALIIKYFVEEIENKRAFSDWYGTMLPLDEILDYTNRVYVANFGDRIFNQLFGDMF